MGTNELNGTIKNFVNILMFLKPSKKVFSHNIIAVFIEWDF